MDHQAASGTYFVSRTELLKWVNSVLPTHIADQLKITKVEQCASGVVYAVLLSFVFPRHSSMIMSRVKMGAKSEYECRHNVKLVQDILSRNDVSRLVEVDRIAKGNYQANLEFLQWLKTFSETQAGLFGGGIDADGGGGGDGIDETHHYHQQHDQTTTASSRGDDTARSSILAGSGTYNNGVGGGGNSSSSPPSPNHARLSVGGGGGGGSPRKSADHSSLDNSGRDRTPSKSSTLHTRGPIRSSPAAATDNSRSSMAKSPSHQQRMAATAAPGFRSRSTGGGASPAGKGGSFVRSRSPRMVPARSTSPLDEDDDGPTLITPSTRGPTSSSTSQSPRPKSSSAASTTFRKAPFNPNPQPTPISSLNPTTTDPQETPVVLPRLDTQHAAEKLEKDRRRSIAAGVTNGGRQGGTARYQDPSTNATAGSSPGGGLRAGRDWYVGGDEEGEKPQGGGGGGFLMDSSDDGDVHDSLNDTGASSAFGAFPLETGKPSDQPSSSVGAEKGEAERKKKAIAAAVAAAQAKKQKRESFGGGAVAVLRNDVSSVHGADTFLNDSLTNNDNANNSSPLLLAGSGSTHNMSGRKDSDSGSAGNWLLSSLPKGALGSPTTGPDDLLDDEHPSSTPPTAVPRFSDQLSNVGSPLSKKDNAPAAASAGGNRLGKAPVAGMSRGSGATTGTVDPPSSSPPGKRPGTKGFQTVTLVNADAQHIPQKGPIMGTPRGSRVDDAMREVKERVRSASRGGDRGGSLSGSTNSGISGGGGNVASSSSASPGGASSPGERRTSSGAVPAVVSLKAATPALGRTSSSLPNTPRIYENGRSPTGGSSPESNSSSTLQAPPPHTATSPAVPASTASSNAASTTTTTSSSPPLRAPPKMMNGHRNNNQQTAAAAVVPPTTKKASSEESAASTQIEGSPSQVQQERDFYLDKLLLIEEALAALSPGPSSSASQSTTAATSLASRGRSPASPPPPSSTGNKDDSSNSRALADRITAILASKDNNLPPLKLVKK